MNTRHVSIRSHLETEPNVVVRDMPLAHSLYNLSRSKDGLLYLVEVNEQAIDDPRSYGLFVGNEKTLEYAPVSRVQLGKEIVMHFKDKRGEGRLGVKEFGIGNPWLTYVNKKQGLEGMLTLLGDIERLANIQHYTPRNSHMPEVRYVDRRFFSLRDEAR